MDSNDDGYKAQHLKFRNGGTRALVNHEEMMEAAFVYALCRTGEYHDRLKARLGACFVRYFGANTHDN